MLPFKKHTLDRIPSIMWALLLGTVTGRAEWDVGAWRSVTRGSSFPGTLACME